MAISRVKVWSAGEILYALDLNSEFNNVLTNALSLISPLTASLNAGGFKITSYGSTDAPSADNDVPNLVYYSASTGASKVGSIQTGTGAVADTVQNKNRRRYDVLDFITQTLHASIKARTNTTDLSSMIQAGMDAVGAAGGGVLVFNGPGDYLCHTATTSGGITNCLATKYDNVGLHLEAGAVLKTDIDANLLGCGGFYKPGGTTGWAAYNARDSANYGGVPFTLYAIASAAKYANAVVLSTPAQSSNFAVADWILVRTGETLTSGTGTPIGEYNKVKAINGGTGALTLEYPLRNAYAAENYPVGHASAGLPAPFGIVNLTQPTNVILQNFRITGTGRMENTSASSSPLINGNQTIGRVVDGPEFVSYGWAFSEGSTLSRHVNTKIHLLGSGATIGYSQDSCNHDWVFDDSTISSVAHAQIHLHEGCSGKIGDGVTVISGTPAAAANVVSIRARAHDISIGGIKIFGFGADASSPAIFSDGSAVGVTDRITIGNALIVGAVNSSAPAVTVSGTNSSVGHINTDTGVLVSPDLGNNLSGDITMFIPATAMFLQQGLPVVALVNSGGSDGWLLDDSTTEGVTFCVRPPNAWQRCQFRLWYVNTTANSGNVRFLVGWNVVADGDTVTIIADGNTSFTDTADSQNKLNKTSIQASSINSITPLKMLNIVVQRVGGNAADTLTGDIALIGVELVRTF